MDVHRAASYLLTEQLEIGYDRPLTKPLDLVMERGNRIVMVGANGIGKTTLLKSLLGLIKPYSGTVHQGDLSGNWLF